MSDNKPNPLKQAIDDATTFQADLDSDLFEVEALLEGAQAEVDVEFAGKVWVFGSIDDFWESWALSEMPSVDDVWVRHRLRKAPYVAAAFLGIRQPDGSLKEVTELFKPKVSNVMMRNLGGKARLGWSRGQFLLWLRAGSKNTTRSGQHGDMVEKFFQQGVMIATQKNREALAKVDPFFGEGSVDMDALSTMLGLKLGREPEAQAAQEAQETPKHPDGPRVATLGGPKELSSSDGLVTF